MDAEVFLDQTDRLLQKSLNARSKQPKFKKSNLYSTQHSDKVNISVKSKSKNSAANKRKAYDKLRKYGAEQYQNEVSDNDLGFVSAESNTNNTNAKIKIHRGDEQIRTSPPKTVQFAPLQEKETNNLESTNQVLEDILQPISTTPRTGNLLELLESAENSSSYTTGKPTELTAPINNDEKYFEMQEKLISHLSSLGEKVGDAIASGISKQFDGVPTVNQNNNNNNLPKFTDQDIEILRRFQNENSVPKTLAEKNVSSDQKKTTNKKLPGPQLHYKNPIRVNRISKPLKSENLALKKHLERIIESKKYLDQNFQYLEHDLALKQAGKDRSPIDQHLYKISNEVGKMSNKEIQKLTEKSKPKSPVKKQGMAGGKSKGTKAKAPSFMKSKEATNKTPANNIAPFPSGMINQTPQQVQPVNPIFIQPTNSAPAFQQREQQLLDFISKNFVSKNDLNSQSLQALPRAIPIAQPLEPPFEISGDSENKKTQETEKPKINLTSEKMPAVEIKAVPKAKIKEKKNKSDPEVLIIDGTAPINPEKIIQDQTIDDMYKTAMSFVEREVTAAVTEKLVKTYLEANELLKAKYKNLDAEKMIEQELEAMILEEISRKNQRKIQDRIEPSSEISEKLATPLVTPRSSIAIQQPTGPRSPDITARQSLTSFRQSVLVNDTIDELDEESEKNEMVKEFEATKMSIEEEIQNNSTAFNKSNYSMNFDDTFQAPEPSAREISQANMKTPVPEIVEKEPIIQKQTNNKSRSTTYSTSIMTNDAKSKEDTLFRSLYTEDLTSNTISYGQVIIEPGEMKYDNKNFKQLMPKYRQEEPGQIQVKVDQKTGKIVNQLSTNIPKPILIGNDTFHNNNNNSNEDDEISRISKNENNFRLDQKVTNLIRNYSLNTSADAEDLASDQEMTPIGSEDHSPRTNGVTDRTEKSVSDGEIVFNHEKFRKWRGESIVRLGTESSISTVVP